MWSTSEERQRDRLIRLAAAQPDWALRPADKGYSYPRCRRFLRQRHIPHTIRERRDHRARRAQWPGRPLAFDQPTYARRTVVVRCINRLKQWHGLATRYEKGAVNYRAMVVIASIAI
jgi:transposase